MKSCKPFDAVVFDMDGVLIDSERLHCRMGMKIAARMGYTLPQGLYLRTLGRTWPDSVKIYKGYYGSDFDVEYFRDYALAAELEHVAMHGYPIKPGVTALLGWLRDRGIPVAVATSTAADRAAAKLTGTGLAPYFPVVVTGDMVARSKPEPDIYLAAAGALGVEAGRCVAFEDSPAGLRAAAAAGMQAVMVPDMVPADSALSALAAAVLPSLADARGWLEGQG